MLLLVLGVHTLTDEGNEVFPGKTPEVTGMATSTWLQGWGGLQKR